MTSFKLPFYRFIEENGDGSGAKVHNLDYSGGKVLKIIPAAGETIILHRMISEVQDTRVGFNVDSFGGLSELTNGIQIKLENAQGVLVDLTGGLPIKTNSDWGRFCYDVARIDYGNGDFSLQSRWTFNNAGMPLKLDSNDGEFLAMYFQDDFRGLSHMSFNFQGYYYDVPARTNNYD